MSDTQPPIVALPSSPIQHGTGAEAPPSSHGLFGEVASAVASAMKSSSISRSRTDLTSRSRPDLTAIAGMRTRLGQIQGMEKGSTGNISRASSMADELDDPGPNGKSDSPLSENVASRVRRLSAAHTAIQAAHQTTASTVPGPASLASRTNTFMAVVQSAKLMSSPTTTESALSKARFYDSIIESLGDGVEEGVALAEAVRAAKEVSAGGGGGAAASPLVSKDSGQRNISGSTMRLAGAEPTAVTALASRRQSLSSSPVPPQNPSIPPHLVLGTIPATDSEAPSPRPSTNVSPHPSRAPTPAAATSGRNKLKGLFNNVIKPSLAMDPKYGTGGGSSAGGAAAGAGQAAGSASSMAKMRMLHRKLQNTVDEYDTVTLDEAYGRERQLLESTRLQLEKTREDVRRAVTAEWEKRCKHDACNSKISMLSRENFLMKDETNRTMKINRELTTAVQALSVFKSNAESEQKLMVNELARRRLRTRTMRKKLNTLRARLKELEERTGITSRDDDASDREGESSELDDEEWEEWCRKTEFCKPTWNISTTTKLLSQHPPASVIHIGDGGNAPFISDDEERRARVEATIKPKRRTKTQVHEKCKHRVDHLNRRLNEERAQKR
ncbi:hypothetical protein DFS34DRAFT_428635 [Phlyctochytrium arcticum]|nr:hypothetical protein DFS34DRAFT_428635 [Phlyctochytrium arcticum]